MDHRAHRDHRDGLHADLSEQVIGAALIVHQALGPGLLETTYQACLAHELSDLGLKCEVEKQLPLRYKNIVLDCGYRVDLIVNDVLIVELKSVQVLLPLHEAQLLTYLKLSGLRVGLLLNFNVALLKQGIKRIVL